MSTTTIRISTNTRNLLYEMARTAGLSMQEVMARALENYRRQQALLALNEAYAALRAEPSTWETLRTERKEWDATLADGLEQV